MRYYPPRFLFRRHAILRLLRPGSTFLEVGAGDLTLTSDLLDHFTSGVAIEPNSDLQRFRSGLDGSKQSRLQVFDLSLESLTINTRFDCVVSCEVLEHIDDDGEFLRQLYDRLDSGGQLIISVPARMKFWTFHDEIVGHIRRYERDELEHVIRAAGFTAVRVIAYGYPFVNILRIPRTILARRGQSDRTEWTTDQQTAQSNHRQIPKGLADSPVRYLTRPALVAPLARFAQIFERTSMSDGFIAIATKK